MAVHTRRPCNSPLHNFSSERDRKDMDFPRPFPASSSALFHDDGGEPKVAPFWSFTSSAAPNPSKRNGESISFPPPSLYQQLSESSRLPPPVVVGLAQTQSQPLPLASTGLRLSFADFQQQQTLNLADPLLSSFSSSLIPQNLAAQINQHKSEIDQFLRVQGEQLQRGLAVRQQKHFRSLLGAVKDSVSRRLREKEAEMQRVAQRSAELEDCLVRLRAESMAWQSKAKADQATATYLHAQLQQVTAAVAAMPQARTGESRESPPVEDAESTFVDPDRVKPERACRECQERLATVVLLPCRHLCLCDACDGGGVAASCPVCHCVKAASVRVFLSRDPECQLPARPETLVNF